MSFSTSNDKTALVSIVPRSDVIYDCGSRDALDGIELARLTGARELHVFECNPAAISICENNIAKYGGGLKVYMNRMALTDHSGTIKFFPINIEKTITDHHDGNIGASSLLRSKNVFAREMYVQDEIEIEATTLDDYARTHNAPDLLWMDLQGAELAALTGARNLLPHIKAIYTEVGFRAMYEGQPLFWDIHAFLRKDYVLSFIETGRWPKSVAAMWAYRLLRTGPWVANALYVRKP